MTDFEKNEKVNQKTSDSESLISNQLIFLNKEQIAHRYVYRIAKRLIDISGSVMGLVILSPVFLIVAIINKFSDIHAPVFYSQIRVGKDEKLFRMYKFRSMYVDADQRLAELLTKNEVEGPMFKMKNDPRITPVGKFIRKYSIDELPQLFNVLLGNMSLVGPRPPLEREVIEYNEFAKQRLLVKPGCTGWWQVNERNKTGFSGMLKRDLEYVQNQSIRFDIRIIFMTVKVLIMPNDAY